MGRNRMEAFSDGVLAIVITIMVLEFQVPHGDTWADLAPLVPVFLSYVLSFLYVGIYWNNHHHLLATVHQVSGTILWSNLLLLFCLSLFPFATAWMGENHFAALPTAVYGVVLLAAALAYYGLERTIIADQGSSSVLGKAVGRDWKGIASLVLYLAAIGVAFVSAWVAQVLFVVVALMWLVPDRRIERAVHAQDPARIA